MPTKNAVLFAAGLVAAVGLLATVATCVARRRRLPAFPASEHCPEGTVYVPAATFLAGGPLERERPQRSVTVRAFCIHGTEVTLAAYRRCIAARACARTGEDGQCNANPLLHDERLEHPVNCVDWTAAGAFCAWAGGRLPSGDEWELAARGTDGRLYPWGNEPPSARRLNAWGGEHLGGIFGPMPVAYSGSDGWRTTAPVGRFPEGASPFGALDMAGNVSEWTTDRFDLYAPPPGSGIVAPTEYATRGASFSEYRPEMLHAATRFGHADGAADADEVGFRCVFDAR